MSGDPREGESERHELRGSRPRDVHEGEVALATLARVGSVEAKEVQRIEST
jgi:hypothetical protein